MTIKEAKQRVDLVDGLILDLSADISVEIACSNVATTKELEEIQQELNEARKHLLSILYAGGDNN